MGKFCTAWQATDDNIIQRMRIACWIPKATNTHSEYVTKSPPQLQQQLHGRASMLRKTHSACLVTQPTMTCNSTEAQTQRTAAFPLQNGYANAPQCNVIRTMPLLLTLRRLMSYIYIYGASILDVSRSHTTTQHSR